MADDWSESIIAFWFDELKPKDWWKKSDALDARIGERFLELWERQKDRPASDFLTSAEHALATTILFDQFPRNMFRGEAKAFSTDALAQQVARQAVDANLDQHLTEKQRPFLYMPFMHAEDLRLQERSVALFGKLGSNEKFAAGHHDAIKRFGRFPHRNAVLGRESSPEELQAVADGSSW